MDAAGGEEDFWQQGGHVKQPWVELALEGRNVSPAHRRERARMLTDPLLPSHGDDAGDLRFKQPGAGRRKLDSECIIRGQTRFRWENLSWSTLHNSIKAHLEVKKGLQYLDSTLRIALPHRAASSMRGPRFWDRGSRWMNVYVSLCVGQEPLGFNKAV